MSETAIKPLHELRYQAILDALVAFKGDKPAACTALGISLKTMYNACHKYGIPLQTGRST